jgi:hypothetical protein
MKILLIHGDNTFESYKRLTEILNNSKEKGYRIENINNKEMDFKEKITAKSLFQEKIVFLLDNINILKSNDTSWLKSNIYDEDLFLIIYNEGLLGKTIINSLPKNTKIEEYKLPQLLWKFLDSFYPGNNKKTLQLLNDCIKNSPKEFVFTMLVRHLKDLYWARIDPKGLEYQEWRITKLQNQAEIFGRKILKDVINELAEIDLKVKKSQAILIDSLDFLIISKLE